MSLLMYVLIKNVLAYQYYVCNVTDIIFLPVI